MPDRAAEAVGRGGCGAYLLQQGARGLGWGMQRCRGSCRRLLRVPQAQTEPPPHLPHPLPCLQKLDATWRRLAAADSAVERCTAALEALQPDVEAQLPGLAAEELGAQQAPGRWARLVQLLRRGCARAVRLALRCGPAAEELGPRLLQPRDHDEALDAARRALKAAQEEQRMATVRGRRWGRAVGGRSALRGALPRPPSAHPSRPLRPPAAPRPPAGRAGPGAADRAGQEPLPRLLCALRVSARRWGAPACAVLRARALTQQARH